MTPERLMEIQNYFNQLDDIKETIPTEDITESYALELLDEVDRLRAALKYIGEYDEGKLNHHSPSTVTYHLKEIAMENLDCEVDYR